METLIRETTMVTHLKKILHSNLTAPIEELRSRPSKNIRALLVSTGSALTTSQTLLKHETLENLKSIIEDIHLGSLIIDDIQDQSPTRRHGKTLHRIIGSAPAINAGNWLYFHALSKAAELDLPIENLNRVYKEIHYTLLKAHEGQALDIGLKVFELPLEDIPQIADKTIELKTGELMALALSLPAICLGENPSHVSSIYNLGKNLGVYLQKMDDLGNLLKPSQQEEESKYLEDLLHSKPGFGWSLLSQYVPHSIMQEYFKQTPSIPKLETLVTQYNIFNHGLTESSLLYENLKNQLFEYLEKARPFQTQLAKTQFIKLLDTIQNAYTRN